jgi:D-arabinose 1-dehydrogenase-like Zn-dependent alcohol dehydrogenase
LLTCGATAGYDPPEDIRYIWTFELDILGSNGWTREDVTALLDLMRMGELKPVIRAAFGCQKRATPWRSSKTAPWSARWSSRHDPSRDNRCDLRH